MDCDCFCHHKAPDPSGETSLLCQVYVTDLFAGYVTVKHTGISIFSPLFTVKFHSSNFSALISGACDLEGEKRNSA